MGSQAWAWNTAGPDQPPSERREQPARPQAQPDQPTALAKVPKEQEPAYHVQPELEYPVDTDESTRNNRTKPNYHWLRNQYSLQEPEQVQPEQVRERPKLVPAYPVERNLEDSH